MRLKFSCTETSLSTALTSALPFFALSVLNRLVEATQGIQHEAVQLAKACPELHSFLASALSVPHRDHNADRQIRRKCKQPCQNMVSSNEAYHNQRS